MKTTVEPQKADTDSIVPAHSGGRGFAGMAPERVRTLGSRGGKAAHEQGRAHEFTSEEARAAGRKGGLASRGRRSPAA
jgi:general stress protein YciG